MGWTWSYQTNGDSNTAINYNLDKTRTSGTYTIATVDQLPTATSDLTNDSGFITDAALTDYATKTYVNNAVGALTIPTKTSDLTNDSGYITNSVSNLTNYYSKSYVDSLVESLDEDIALKADASDLNDYTKTADLATVATTGSYTDLSNKPDLTVYAETADLGDCAYLDEDELSIAYSQITGTPTIPTATSQLTNDSGFITGVAWNDVTNKPTFATVATTGDYDDLTDKPDLSVYELKTDAFSGDYDDLTNKPTIPTDTSDLTNGAGFITSSALSGYATETWVGNQGYITGITSSDVTTALGYTPGTSNFSGDYEDLTNKPTIGNGYMQIFYKVPGGSYNLAATFRANQVGTVGAYLEIPTVSANPATTTGTLTGIEINGTNYAINSGTTYTAGTGIDITSNEISIDNTVALKTDIPTVPTNVSAFTNDAGYITGITDTMINTALGYTAADAADVPTTASSTSTSTSTSTVTPTTVTLTFTYSDDTTENVTLMTGASVATSTTTTTTTTLS